METQLNPALGRGCQRSISPGNRAPVPLVRESGCNRGTKQLFEDPSGWARCPGAILRRSPFWAKGRRRAKALLRHRVNLGILVRMDAKGGKGRVLANRPRPAKAMRRRKRRVSIGIREAVARDVPFILRLIRELAVYEKLIDEVEATEETLGRTLFPPGGTAPAARVLIGEVDGRRAGFALYFFNYSTFLARPGVYLEDIYVLPGSRRRGLGRALLLHVAGIAKARGCGRVEWSVLDWNTPARDFYRALGALPLDEWTVFRLTGPKLRELGG